MTISEATDTAVKNPVTTAGKLLKHEEFFERKRDVKDFYEPSKKTVAGLLENLEKNPIDYELIRKHFKSAENLTDSQIKDSFLKILRKHLPTLTVMELAGNQHREKEQQYIFAMVCKHMGPELISDFDKSGNVSLDASSKSRINNVNTISLEIQSKMIEGSEYASVGILVNKEDEADFTAFHGGRYFEEVLDILFTDLITTINADYVRLIEQNSMEVEVVFDIFQEEAEKAFNMYIQRASAEIARKTKRGIANHMIVDPFMYTFIESLSSFKPTKNESFGQPTGLKYVGYFGEKGSGLKVFLYPYFAEKTVILGYSGEIGFDNGIFYCPFKLIDLEEKDDKLFFKMDKTFIVNNAESENHFAKHYFTTIRFVEFREMIEKKESVIKENLEPPFFMLDNSVFINCDSCLFLCNNSCMKRKKIYTFYNPNKETETIYSLLTCNDYKNKETSIVIDKTKITPEIFAELIKLNNNKSV